MPQGSHLDDHLTLDDKLNRLSMLHEVYRHVTSAKAPCVIGVHGDWGSGKSSFLIQLEALLTDFSQSEGNAVGSKKPDGQVKSALKSGLGPLPKYPVVWFEAWRYQNDPQPVLTLLREIREQLSPSRKFGDTVKKEAAVTIETALTGIDGIAKLIGLKINPKEIREIGERYERESFQVPSLTVSITDLLDHAVQTIVTAYAKKSDADRLVVLIDDLDRCSPETAQAILEGLKVFLNLEHVVFVLAMDETAIEEYLAGKYSDLDSKSEGLSGQRSRMRARQYLEKLCQSVYRLPFATNPEALFLQYLTECGAETIHTQALSSLWVGLHVVPPNPRKIKLLAGVTWRFLRNIDRVTRTREQAALAYLIAYCFQFHPELYRLIETYKTEVFYEWLLPAVGIGERTISDSVRSKLTLPRGLLGTSNDHFPDPVREGVFYPAQLLLSIGVPTTDEISRIIGS